MAYNRFIFTISILLAFLATTTTAHEIATRQDKTATVVVEGKVYCQRCKYYGSWSPDRAEPLSEAKVSVVCKNYKKRVSYYKRFVTNDEGYFYAELKDYKMTHSLLDHPLHACRVILVSSPHETCNLLSNVNNGIKGSPLRFENKVFYERNYEFVVYAAGPLAFRSNDCDLETTP